jgi:hypothetical protein
MGKPGTLTQLVKKSGKPLGQSPMSHAGTSPDSALSGRPARLPTGGMPGALTSPSLVDLRAVDSALFRSPRPTRTPPPRQCSRRRGVRGHEGCQGRRVVQDHSALARRRAAGAMREHTGLRRRRATLLRWNASPCRCLSVTTSPPPRQASRQRCRRRSGSSGGTHAQPRAAWRGWARGATSALSAKGRRTARSRTHAWQARRLGLRRPRETLNDCDQLLVRSAPWVTKLVDLMCVREPAQAQQLAGALAPGQLQL